MVQPRSIITISDNSGARVARVVKVLGGTRKRYGRLGDVIVVSNRTAAFTGVGEMLEPGQALVDLAHAVDRSTVTRGEYHGLAW
jgi:ribosomal protein L14